jgi:hypothetical protein
MSTKIVVTENRFAVNGWQIFANAAISEDDKLRLSVSPNGGVVLRHRGFDPTGTTIAVTVGRSFDVRAIAEEITPYQAIEILGGAIPFVRKFAEEVRYFLDLLSNDSFKLVPDTDEGRGHISLMDNNNGSRAGFFIDANYHEGKFYVRITLTLDPRFELYTTSPSFAAKTMIRAVDKESV